MLSEDDSTKILEVINNVAHVVCQRYKSRQQGKFAELNNLMKLFILYLCAASDFQMINNHWAVIQDHKNLESSVMHAFTGGQLCPIYHYGNIRFYQIMASYE